MAFTRGHLRIHTVSPPGMSRRMDNTKDWARRLEREVSGTQTLSAENRTIATVSGVCLVSGAFTISSLDHRDPEVAMRTLAGAG